MLIEIYQRVLGDQGLMNVLSHATNLWQQTKGIAKALFFPPEAYANQLRSANLEKLIAQSQILEQQRPNYREELAQKRQAFELVRLKCQYLNNFSDNPIKTDKTQLSPELQLKITEYIDKWKTAGIYSNIEFQQLLALEKNAIELELRRCYHEFSFLIAFVQANISLCSEDYRRILNNYPWRLDPIVILEEYQQYCSVTSRIPPLIIISSPEIEYDDFPQPTSGLPKMQKAIEENLRLFLNKYYHKSSQTTPTDLAGGAWDTKTMRSETAVKLLSYLLKSIPVIILDSEIDGDKLNFRIACWDIGKDYSYDPIITSFCYKGFLYRVAKESAQEWEQQKQQLLSQNISLETLLKNPEYLEHELNIEILKQEIELKKYGLEKALALDYKPNRIGAETLNQYWSVLNCFCASLATDFYYFKNYDELPKTPHLLYELTQELAEDEINNFLEITIEYFDFFCEYLEAQGSKKTPSLYLELALGLTKFSAKKFGQKQLEKSFMAFFKLHNITPGSDLADNVSKLEHSVQLCARPYVEKINECFKALNLSLEIKLGEAYYKEGVKYYEAKEYQAAIASFEEALSVGYDQAQRNLITAKQALIALQTQQQENQIQAQNHETQGDLEFNQYEYEKAIAYYEKATNFGSATAKTKLFKATTIAEKYKYLDLGRGVILELVKIPGGSFSMGGEHEINFKGFFLGKYPVTQKQYQVVMGTNPSNFKGEDLPVECVNWQQAKEFCQKLSFKTRRQIMLPSETQWEYAARAGTTTDYFFGNNEEILGEYAWYSQNSLGKTQPVGQKKPNPWGLYDMLGNVWEWCQDDWESDYHHLPQDGSAYVNNSEQKARRGGSWLFKSFYCRCPYRYWNNSSSSVNSIGFRILVVFAP